VCVPGNTVDESFAGRPAVQRDIYEEIIAYLRTLGPVYIDAVRVGVFLYHVDKIAEVRPKVRALGLWLMMPRDLDDPRIGRVDRFSSSRTAHYLKLATVSDVDEQLRDWLGEAYDAAG
jgi:hypothetical protein